jgi:hypothetical protein
MNPEFEAKYKAHGRESFEKAVQTHEQQVAKEKARTEKATTAGILRHIIESSQEYWEKYIECSNSAVSEADVRRELNVAESVARELDAEHQRLIERARQAMDNLTAFERDRLGGGRRAD